MSIEGQLHHDSAKLAQYYAWTCDGAVEDDPDGEIMQTFCGKAGRCSPKLLVRIKTPCEIEMVYALLRQTLSGLWISAVSYFEQFYLLWLFLVFARIICWKFSN